MIEGTPQKISKNDENAKERLKNEEKLISLAKKGHKEAFALLYGHYSPSIFRFIYYRLNSKDAAEDLTQEVFLRAWGNLKFYKSRGFPFSSWLYRISKNAIIDHFRTDKSNNLISLDEEKNNSFPLKDTLADTGNILEKIDSDIELEKVKKALRQLNDIQKETIIPRFINDINISQVAKIIKKSVPTARVIQHRAIKNLKKILEA